MKQETIMCKIFNFSIATYYKRKREKNHAIYLIEKYFSKEDLEEFIKEGQVKEFNRIIKIKDSNEYKLFKEFLEFRKEREI